MVTAAIVLCILCGLINIFNIILIVRNCIKLKRMTKR
jgi:hypothetical protein